MGSVEIGAVIERAGRRSPQNRQICCEPARRQWQSQVEPGYLPIKARNYRL